MEKGKWLLRPLSKPQERWAVVMYIRALQRSRNASVEELDAAERAKIVEE